MSHRRLTDELAVRALQWRKSPGRYLTSGRSWIPESRFRPFFDIRDAFRLLEAVTGNFSLLSSSGNGFTAEVRVCGQVGRAKGDLKAKAISLAVARALGIQVPLELEATPAPGTNSERGNHGA